MEMNKNFYICCRSERISKDGIEVKLKLSKLLLGRRFLATLFVSSSLTIQIRSFSLVSIFGLNQF